MVADLLRDMLFSNEVPPGGKLPSVLELARRFGVSGNTIVKATALLRAEGLLRTKRGQGIFSSISPIYQKIKTASAKTPTVSEKKTPNLEITSAHGGFGCWLSKRKIITLLLEDSRDWQLAFWSDITQRFMRENPDIKLQLLTGSDEWELNDLDMYIGGESSIRELDVRHNFSMGLDILKQFGLPDYGNYALTPELCGSSNSGAVLPIGYGEPALLANKNFQPPDNAAANVLELLEQADQLNKHDFKYQLWAGRSLLYNCGCQLGSGDQIAELASHRSEIEKLREYAERNMLIWHHTEETPEAEPLHFLSGPGARICEVAPLTLAQAAQQDVYQITYPAKKYFAPIPVIAVINARTHFPEEALRLVKLLLQSDVQQEIAQRLFIHQLADAVNDDRVYCNRNEAQRSRTLSMICWEFYYYLRGKTEDFDAFLTACINKIKHLRTLE